MVVTSWLLGGGSFPPSVDLGVRLSAPEFGAELPQRDALKNCDERNQIVPSDGVRDPLGTDARLVIISRLFFLELLFSSALV